MTSQGKSRQRSAAIAAAIAALSLTLAPSALAAQSRPADGDLSPRLAELAEPAVRSASRSTQARRLSLPVDGPGSLLRRGDRILVEVRPDGPPRRSLAGLRSAGARILHVSDLAGSVTAAVPPTALSALARLAGVGRVSELLAPIVFAGPGSAAGPIGAAATPPCLGAATSEGDLQLGAMEARDGYGFDGTGVTVGILSDSFNRDAAAQTDAEEDVASGDLPGPGNPCGMTQPVRLLGDPEAGGADEGRGMAQIVHDLAPGAKIAFASAFTGPTQFAYNIRRLPDPVDANGAGARVIVDDVLYLEEPFFQDGPIAAAVNEVSEDDVAYFSAAGNDNLVDSDGNDIASWEAPEFRETACPADLALAGPNNCMDFDPAPAPAKVDPTFGFTVSAGAELLVDLQWAEPWYGVKSDLDAYLLDSTGNVIASATEDNLDGPGSAVTTPLEILAWENSSSSPRAVRLVIHRCVEGCNPAANPASKPRLKFVFVENGLGVESSEYPKSSGGDVVGPTIFGHMGAAGATSVGAVPFSSSAEPEEYSSQGPVAHYFGPVDEGTEIPALPLGSPEVLDKPDLVATDGGANTFFGSCAGRSWRFFGTSAAAPHAAAVAALQREAAPAAMAIEVAAAQRLSGRPVGAFGSEAVGAGLLHAPTAIEELTGVPFPGGTHVAPPVSENCGLPTPPQPPTTPAPIGNVAAPLDTAPPGTSFGRRPREALFTRSRTAKALFTLRSSEAGSSFLCRIDRAVRFRACSERFVRRFGLGRHTVRAKAVDAAGNADPTPAVARFAVRASPP